MRNLTARALHLMMGVYLAASAMVMLDDAGVGGEESVLAAAAEAVRESTSSNDPFGLVEEFDSAVAAVRRLAGAFGEAGSALD